MRHCKWLIGAFVVSALAGCGHKHHEEEVPELEAVHPIRQDIKVVDEYVCQIRASQHIELRAIESGYLRKYYVQEGQFVKKGAKLFRLVPIVYQAEAAKAAAEAKRAEIAFKNTQILNQGKVVSKNRLALVDAERSKAMAEKALAQAHLKFATVRAPFSGIVGRLQVRRGSLVEDGDLLTVLSDNRLLWVYFNVSEARYLTYRRQHKLGEKVPVRLRLANGDVFKHEGVVTTIEADFNNRTGTIAFRADFPNPERILRHKQTGTVLMTRVIKNQLIVPQKAGYDVLDQKFVYVIGKDGHIHARQIEVKDEIDHSLLISDGLKEHDLVLLEGLRRVSNGDRVKPRLRKTTEVLAKLRHLHAE